MKPLFALFAIVLLSTSCKKPSGSSTPEPVSDIPTEELTRLVLWDGDGKDLQGEIVRFRGDVRLRYNNRQFAELEIIARTLREGYPTFTDGYPRIIGFYDSFECRKDESEGMWQLHDQIHKDWIAAFPGSVTAKVAHADFLTEYAWHARGDKPASEVADENMKTFHERLRIADTVLVGCAEQREECPVWSLVKMRAALGLETEPTEYDRIFRQAKADFPKFYKYDTYRAHYLLPRWHGAEGEWEKVAHNEIFLPDGGGHATYARVIREQWENYDSVFEETDAKWPEAKKGFDEILKQHPNSLVMLNIYCRLACEAGEAVTALELFQKIGDTPVPAAWRTGKHDIFEQAKTWAAQSQN